MGYRITDFVVQQFEVDINLLESILKNLKKGFSFVENPFVVYGSEHIRENIGVPMAYNIVNGSIHTTEDRVYQEWGR